MINHVYPNILIKKVIMILKLNLFLLYGSTANCMKVNLPAGYLERCVKERTALRKRRNAYSEELCDAAYKGDIAVVKRLVEEDKKRANGQAINGKTPLHWAALVKQTGIVVPVFKNGVTPLHQAAGSGEVETLKVWLRGGADPNIRTNKGETPLHYAIKSGCPKTIELLLEQKGIDIDARNEFYITPLTKAIRFNYKKAIRLLLQASADPNKEEEKPEHTPLCISIIKNHTFSVEELLTAGADPNRGIIGGSPLRVAARKGYLSIVQALLKKGANKDIYDERGTALFEALDNNHISVFLALLQAGADPNRGALVFTPLHIAIYQDNIPLVKLLLAHGANPALSAKCCSRRLVEYTTNPELISILLEAEAKFYAKICMDSTLRNIGNDTRAANQEAFLRDMGF